MKEYKIVDGPETEGFRRALLHGDIVSFTTDSGAILDVKVISLQRLNDDGHNAWKIQGTFEERDSVCLEFGKCMVMFTEKDHTGDLSELTKDKNTVEELDKLSNLELERRIKSSRRSAQSSKARFMGYLKTLPYHDRLVVEARATIKLSMACTHSELDFKFYKGES